MQGKLFAKMPNREEKENEQFFRRMEQTNLLKISLKVFFFLN